MVRAQDVKIEESWKQVLHLEFEQGYFAQIKAALLADKQKNIKVFPPGSLIFNAFNSTAFHDVKIVIIGQDPYHQPQQAMGLSFSVPKTVRIPPSLQNIYKELARSIEGFITPSHGDLSSWASQGVFLLNAVLTVRQGQAASHSQIGWQQFTDAVIRNISEHREGVIFMLWGNFAKNKATLIDESKHHILTSVHPSPLAGGAFVGCGHFSKANEILRQQGLQPIDWQV